MVLSDRSDVYEGFMFNGTLPVLGSPVIPVNEVRTRSARLEKKVYCSDDDVSSGICLMLLSARRALTAHRRGSSRRRK